MSDAHEDDQQPRHFDQQHEILALARESAAARLHLSAIASAALAEYQACQRRIVAAARSGGPGLGQHAMAAGVAHRFYRMAERPAHLVAMFPESFNE